MNLAKLDLGFFPPSFSSFLSFLSFVLCPFLKLALPAKSPYDGDSNASNPQVRKSHGKGRW
jgi:hypothetical protein